MLKRILLDSALLTALINGLLYFVGVLSSVAAAQAFEIPSSFLALDVVSTLSLGARVLVGVIASPMFLYNNGSLDVALLSMLIPTLLICLVVVFFRQKISGWSTILVVVLVFYALVVSYKVSSNTADDFLLEMEQCLSEQTCEGERLAQVSYYIDDGKIEETNGVVYKLTLDYLVLFSSQGIMVIRRDALNSVDFPFNINT
ncbi:hypothetical protein ACQEXU_21910 [Vibrio sp. TRT 21S02]|uniref:hypothetical protein n=1 Tax=Vibrio TaxID=662 RepID=UPI00034C9E52|nr:hypothetical protein [Vibrio parahaemolyticus]